MHYGNAACAATARVLAGYLSRLLKTLHWLISIWSNLTFGITMMIISRRFDWQGFPAICVKVTWPCMISLMAACCNSHQKKCLPYTKQPMAMEMYSMPLPILEKE